jgi:hypothetical protein
MEREVLFYLSQPQVEKVILQTPNTVCESNFFGNWKDILLNGMNKSNLLCRDWVLTYGRLSFFFILYFNIILFLTDTTNLLLSIMH